MLTIPVGHTMASLMWAPGGVDYVSATLATRRLSVEIREAGERVAVTSADQVVIDDLLQNGAALAIHNRGGMPKGTGLLWETDGTNGDLLPTGAGRHAQFVDLTLSGARSTYDTLRKRDIPMAYARYPDVPLPARNVTGIYKCMANDLRNGTHTEQSFDTAVANHQLSAATALAASTGQRVRPGDM